MRLVLDRVGAVLLVLVASPALAAAPKPCLTAAEAVAAIGALPELDARLTPPLPVSWPPSGPPALRAYDFRTEALPTGIVSYALHSPGTEFTVSLDGGTVRRRSVGKRARLGVWTPPVDPPRAALGSASTLLVRLACEGRGPTGPEAATLREGYGAWLADEPQVKGWLARENAPFLAWLAARPVPPPAPPDSRLTARLDGAAVVLTRDGQGVRLVRDGLAAAQLVVVPLRADGTEAALWVTLEDPRLGALGLLVRYDSPPQVVYTHVYASGQRGILRRMHSPWLLDVDGDGWNDVVTHTVAFSDVGPQREGVTVSRFDATTGAFSPGDRGLERRAPSAPPGSDERVQRLLTTALHAREVELRGTLDGQSVPQTPPPSANSLLGNGTPPFVGPNALRLVLARTAAQPLAARYHLVHLRHGREPTVVSTLDLGPVVFPVNGCGGRQEELRREPGAVVVVWSNDGRALVEQRVPWDGSALGPPATAPREVARCAGP